MGKRARFMAGSATWGLALAAGSALLLVLAEARASTDPWQPPLWRELRPLHGYDGADTAPGHDLMTDLHDATSLRVLIAAGSLALEPAIEAEAADAVEVAARLPALERALAQYPPGLLAGLGLETIGLAGHLRLRGHEIDGAEFWRGHIVLSTRARDLTWVVHHELSHAVDLASPGALSGWNLLNPTGFAYRPDDWNQLALPPSCFVSHYATSSPQDDRAEVFAAVMVGHPRLAHDRCLQAKAGWLARALSRLGLGLPEAFAAHLPPGQ